VLIQEKGTLPIFDIAPLRYTEYRKERVYHEVLEDQTNISKALEATAKAQNKGDGINSIVNLLSLISPAIMKEFRGEESSPMMRIVMAEMGALRQEFRNAFRTIDRSLDMRRGEESDDVEVMRLLLDEAENIVLTAGDDLDRLRRGIELCEECRAIAQGSSMRGKRVSPKSRDSIRRILNNIDGLRAHAMDLIRSSENREKKSES